MVCLLTFDGTSVKHFNRTVEVLYVVLQVWEVRQREIVVDAVFLVRTDDGAVAVAVGSGTGTGINSISGGGGGHWWSAVMHDDVAGIVHT